MKLKMISVVVTEEWADLGEVVVVKVLQDWNESGGRRVNLLVQDDPVWLMSHHDSELEIEPL